MSSSQVAAGAHLSLDFDAAPVLESVAKGQQVARYLAHLDAAWVRHGGGKGGQVNTRYVSK